MYNVLLQLACFLRTCIIKNILTTIVYNLMNPNTKEKERLIGRVIEWINCQYRSLLADIAFKMHLYYSHCDQQLLSRFYNIHSILLPPVSIVSLELLIQYCLISIIFLKKCENFGNVSNGILVVLYLTYHKNQITSKYMCYLSMI